MIRKYGREDKEKVLALLRLNTPRYFDPAEEQDLSLYLDGHADDYYVVEEKGHIIGSGGINFFSGEDLARISWDIIHPHAHGKGIGATLTRFRIELITKNSVSEVQVRTSQHVYRFYEKMGFSTLRILKDFWAPGIDLYDMRLYIDRP